MKAAPPEVAGLSWPQVHAFRLERHHLSRRAPGKDLARVVGEIGGAQAQLMSAAELQIAVRVDCNVEDVRQALWTDRTLVKTWLMRGTLHLARADDLPLYTSAMGKRWIRVRPSWLNFWQVTEPELWKLVDDIGGARRHTDDKGGADRPRRQGQAGADSRGPEVRVGWNAEALGSLRSPVLRAEPRPERHVRQPAEMAEKLA